MLAAVLPLRCWRWGSGKGVLECGGEGLVAEEAEGEVGDGYAAEDEDEGEDLCVLLLAG